MKRRKQWLASVGKLYYYNVFEQLIGEHQINLLGEKITELHYDLMKFEMQLVDQVDVRKTLLNRFNII